MAGECDGREHIPQFLLHIHWKLQPLRIQKKKDVPASTGSIAIANRKMKTWLPASRLALLAVLESGGPGWFETIDVVTLLIYQDTQLIYYAG